MRLVASWRCRSHTSTQNMPEETHKSRKERQCFISECKCWSELEADVVLMHSVVSVFIVLAGCSIAPDHTF